MSVSDDGDAVEIKAEELRNHVVSTVRDWFKAERAPWGTMTHAEQASLLRRAELLAAQVIRDVVRTVAAEDRAVFDATPAGNA